MMNINTSAVEADASLSANAKLRLSETASISYVVFGVLFVFFVFLILNSQVDSDGGWFLYGKLLRRGLKLYTDLHLPLQPFFFLETAWWQSILGPSWIASQIPAVIHMSLYLTGYFLLSRGSDWRSWQKAAIFAGAALTGVGWASYRFDDYRIIADLCFIFATIVLLRVVDGAVSSKARFPATVGLGGLCGLCFATRPNDGLFLYLAAATVLFHTLPKGRILSIFLLSVSAAAAVLIIVALTGDSFANYINYTIRGAAAMKGGSHQVLFTPFMLAWDLIRTAFDPASAFVLVLVGACTLYTGAWRRLQSSDHKDRLVVRVAFTTATILIGIDVVGAFDRIDHYFLPVVLAPFILLVLCGFGIYTAAVVLGLRATNNRRLILLVVPCGALLAAGMSTGGKELGIFMPIGLFLVLGPIVFSSTRVKPWLRIMVMSVCGFLGLSICLNKIETPLSWEYYISTPMFFDRAVINHPIHGKMIVDTRIDKFFSRVCNKIESGDGKEELLSLPYSYANYYCGIDPWGNYVQTFFDTSSAQTIGEVVRGLKSQPPAWILYQRQPRILRLNEIFYNHGARLAHRDLDDVIMREISQGAWSIRSSWREWGGDNWVLIRTAPANGEAGRTCSAAIMAHLKAVPEAMRDDESNLMSVDLTDTFEWDRECA